MEKNHNIELIRIVAGLFVIMAHLVGTYIVFEDEFDVGLLYIDGMTRCSVPVFFMISGYFMDSHKPLVRQYKNFLKRVLLPTLLTIIVCGMLIPCVVEMLLGTKENIPSIRDAAVMILTGRIDEFQHCYPLWYIVELVKCYIFLPVLQMLCSDERHVVKVRRYILAIGALIVAVVPSLDMMTGIDLSSRFFYAPVTIFMWYILLGYEMKVWFTAHQKSNKGFAVGFLGFLLGSFGVFGFAYYRDYLVNGEVIRTFFANHFILLVIASAGLFMALSNIKINGHKAKQIIDEMGSTIFGVYLVHPVVYSVIWHLGIENLIGVTGRRLFFLIFAFLTFFCSMACIMVLKNILYLMTSKWKKGERYS